MGAQAKTYTEAAMISSQDQLTDYQGQVERAQAQVGRQRRAYEDIQFTNPYAGMENPYAENVYEDLTVNLQQAEFEAQQGAQQRANIMQGLRGAAGSSGIAGLAQSLASQGQLQAQQASASIGQQEAMNQRLRAQGAQQVQAGAAAVDLQRRQGEIMRQEAESGRAATLLGMEFGALAGAQAGQQAAYGNVQAAYGMEANRIQANQQMWVDAGTSILDIAGSFAKSSDRRLKKNINKIGKSPSGLNIYSFEYKDSKYGKGLFQGVMSDEIPQNAVVKMDDGYDSVNYSILDVEFKQI